MHVGRSNSCANVVDVQEATSSFSQHRGRGDHPGGRTANGRLASFNLFYGNLLSMSSYQLTKREETPRAIIHMLSHIFPLTLNLFNNRV